MVDFDEWVFASSRMAENAIKVLDEGLPDVIGRVDHDSVVPMAHWKDSGFGAVLFLRYSIDDQGESRPGVVRAVCRRDESSWVALPNWSGSGWSHDPLEPSETHTDLGDRTIYVAGGSRTDHPRDGEPAIVVCGRHSPQVESMFVHQNGRTIMSRATGHWGAWIVCLAEWAPYTITVLDGRGVTRGQLVGPSDLPAPGSFA